VTAIHPFVGKLEQETTSVLDTIREMVELESPTTDKTACSRFGSYLKQRLTNLGAKVESVSCKDFSDHIRATLPFGHGTQKPAIMLLGHMDTVWPVGEIERRPFRIEGDMAFGPGIYDMKGGIALAIHALEYMKRNGHTPKRPIQMVWNSDEEVGSPTSRKLIETVAAESAHVLVFEPGDLPEGQVNTFRKGVINFKVEVRGRSAHAGANHPDGRNAICELARLVLRLEAMTDYDIGTTVNVGKIEGGNRVNVVPAHAAASVDVRVSTAQESERMLETIRSLAIAEGGFRVTTRGIQSRPPLERHAAVENLYNKAKQVAESLKLSLPERPSGGASDGNFTAAMGKGTLCGIGIVGTGAHALDERIVIDWIPKRLAVIIRILEILD